MGGSYSDASMAGVGVALALFKEVGVEMPADGEDF